MRFRRTYSDCSRDRTYSDMIKGSSGNTASGVYISGGHGGINRTVENTIVSVPGFTRGRYIAVECSAVDDYCSRVCLASKIDHSIKRTVIDRNGFPLRYTKQNSRRGKMSAIDRPCSLIPIALSGDRSTIYNNLAVSVGLFPLYVPASIVKVLPLPTMIWFAVIAPDFSSLLSISVTLPFTVS